MADPYSDNPIQGRTQAELLDALGVSKAARGNNRTWGVVYSHRQACVRYLHHALLRLLDDPDMTRGKLRVELERLCKQVEEHGPPSGSPL
jgi:hypothetical protein